MRLSVHRSYSPLLHMEVAAQQPLAKTTGSATLIIFLPCWVLVAEANADCFGSCDRSPTNQQRLHGEQKHPIGERLGVSTSLFPNICFCPSRLKHSSWVFELKSCVFKRMDVAWDRYYYIYLSKMGMSLTQCGSGGRWLERAVHWPEIR